MSKQKTILILLGGTSAINASLTLVNSLVERGYRIVYMSAARFRGHVEKLGFAFQAFSFMDVANREKEPDKAGNWIERYRLWNRQRFVTRDRLFDWADQWLDEIRPDLLLLDSNLYSYSVPFLKKKYPDHQSVDDACELLFAGETACFFRSFSARKPPVVLAGQIGLDEGLPGPASAGTPGENRFTYRFWRR
jgi:hypothetical protein